LRPVFRPAVAGRFVVSDNAMPRIDFPGTARALNAGACERCRGNRGCISQGATGRARRCSIAFFHPGPGASMRVSHRNWLVIAAAIVGVISCGGGGAALIEPPPPKFTSVVITPDSAEVAVGAVLQLAASARDEDGVAMSGLPPVVWSVEDTTIATAVSNVITGQAVGSTRIFASVTEGEVTHADTARLVVSAAAAGGPTHPVNTPGTSFAPATLTVTVGDTVTWVFGGATHNVSFTLAAPVGGDIPDQTPPSQVARVFSVAGQYAYECTRHANMRGTIIVQSGQVSQFTSVGISPAALSMLVGGTAQFTAVPLDQSGIPMAGLPGALFLSSNTAVAVVSSAGLLTAASAGVDTLTATITSGGATHAATAIITVRSPSAGATVTTPNLAFAPSTVTIQAGQVVTWEFSGAVHNVTWLPGPVPSGGDVLDQAVGSVVQRTFPVAGVYSYECTRHNNMTGTVVVQSGQAQLFTSVAVAPATASLLVGGTVALVATPLDQSGVPMVGLPAPVYQTSNAAVATVDAGGVVTAQGAGSANIGVTITTGATTHGATSTIIVTAPVPGGVTVTTPNLSFAPATVSIAAGATVTWQFSGNTHNVTFSGAQPPGGNIPDQPAGASQSRTFVSAGSYGYVCTRHSGMTGTIVVTGGGVAVYSSLQVLPQSPSVVVGSTVQVDATPLDQNGAVMAGLPAPTYQSSNPLAATVSSTGLVTGVAAGSATITATLTSGATTHTGTAVVTVGTVAAATILTPGLTFNPDDVQIRPGETVVWQISGSTHNITFETIAPPGGNAGDAAPGTNVARTFTQAGDYKYFCSIHKNQGMNGKIRVQ
jgi:plastocyanin